jgi:hypothetical protein
MKRLAKRWETSNHMERREIVKNIVIEMEAFGECYVVSEEPSFVPGP